MLSDEDRAILDFERASLRESGPKDQTIEMVLGLTSAAYYERLVAVLSTRAGSAYDPFTAKRVLRLIESVPNSEFAV
jgi:hypothetical protein